MARTLKVHEKAVVVVLTKPEAKALLRGIEGNYFQATALVKQFTQKIQDALAEVTA